MDDVLTVEELERFAALLERYRPLDSDDPEWLHKADYELRKAAPELTGGVETATEYLMNERGHPEPGARQLAEFLNRDDHAHSIDEAIARDKQERADERDTSAWDIVR
jgi:hypothetical protein